MLKGFFYRRMPENNHFPTNVFIRFEINSKESILAKVAYLSQEGIQFFLPRGKVILVPDERMLLILNSPEHGEFKIPSDVYYFCNINNHDGQEQVCYGVKFFELSASTWEVILDFCGDQFPEITFLSPSGNGQANEKPANQAVISPKDAKKPAAASPSGLPRTEIPATPFIPLPPLIPVETANVISDLVTALHPTQKTERPVEQQKVKSIIPEIPLSTKIEASLPPYYSSSASRHKLEAGAQPVPKERTQPSVAAVATNPPVHIHPDMGPIPVVAPSPATATVNKEAAKAKLESKSIPNIAVSKPEARQETKENHPTKSNPSSIQVLAASLATPPVAHTQPKAQSLSQEMIDRLIEKLQAESAGEPTEPLPLTPANPLPNHLRVSASELDDAYQNMPQPGQADSFGKMTTPLSDLSFTSPNIPGAPFKTGNFQSGALKQSETKSNIPAAQPTAANPAGATPFDPFAAFNFKTGNAITSENKPEGPGQAEAATKTEPASFDPFKTFNFNSGNSSQPENQLNESGASPVNNQTPFDPFALFNIQSNPTATPTSKSNEPAHSGVKFPAHNNFFENSQKAPATAALDQGGASLGDFMNNLDSTINKNVTPVVTNKPIQQGPRATAKTTPKTAPNISLEDLKNMELPYSGKETNLADASKKNVSPAPVAMTNTPAAKTSGTTAATQSKPEKAAAPTLKKPTIGPAIISNAPGVSLDQKAIDKLVDSLIQDMAADEPAPTEPPDLPNLTKQATPLGNGMILKKEVEPKISPAIPAESAAHFSSPNNKGPNTSNFDHGNARVMDQKSIDMIVKTLTEAESGTTDTPNLKAGQPALANTIPLKPFTSLETKRTLDQKAIDQVVQALTQNFAAKNKTTDASNGAAIPFSNHKTGPAAGTPLDFQDKGRNAAFSATSLSAVLLLETGEVLHAVVEQIYVGGLIVTLDRELPLNSTLKLNISGNSIHITDVLGTCTNCEPAASGKNGFLAEIFFKNINNIHMEQFRTLIAKMDSHHQI